MQISFPQRRSYSQPPEINTWTYHFGNHRASHYTDIIQKYAIWCPDIWGLPDIFFVIDFHLISLWLENILCNNFKHIETYFYDPKYNLSWQIFFEHLKRMYVLLLLGGVLYK